jgi:hypothetical protein
MAGKKKRSGKRGASNSKVNTFGKNKPRRRVNKATVPEVPKEPFSVDEAVGGATLYVS